LRPYRVVAAVCSNRIKSKQLKTFLKRAKSIKQYYRARYYDTEAGRFLSEDNVRFLKGDPDFYPYTLNRPTNFVDPSGNVSISGGFSPQCLADILTAINILKSRPACNCWFASHGLHFPLKQMLDNPAYTIRYYPKREHYEGGTTLGFVNPGIPNDPYLPPVPEPFSVYLTPDACESGAVHIAQDIAHELAHLTLSQFQSWYQKLKPADEKRLHNQVRLVESQCGFAIQTTGSSITVTP